MHLEVLKLGGIVVNNNGLESVRKIRLSKPNTTSTSSLWQERHSVLWGLLVALWNSFILLSLLSAIDINFKLVSSSSLGRRRPVGLHHFTGISPPVVDEMLFGLLNLVVSEDGQVVDNRVFANTGLDLDELVLIRCLFDLLVSHSHLGSSLLTSELAILILGHGFVSLTHLGGRSERRRILFLDALISVGNGVHINELILKDVHESITKSRNDVGLMRILVSVSGFAASCHGDS